jgi:urease accessory protein
MEFETGDSRCRVEFRKAGLHLLQSASGAGLDAAREHRNAPVHQLNARLELRFDAGGGRTRMRLGTQQPPWRVIRAFPQENGAALVHLHNVSGGVLAGDDLRLDIEVGSQARAQVTSTGATRVYRHREGSFDSQQTTSISLAEGALLEYLPDALIPFAGSRHRQSTRITLADGATLFGWEIVAPGRQAMGERFRFHSLRLTTRIESRVGPVLLEDFLLEPETSPLLSPARLGDYTHTATFYAVQVGRPAPDLLELERRLGEIAIRESRQGCTIWGTSALASDGVVIKGLSTSAYRISDTLAVFWTAARRFLIGDAPVPPRKLK